MKTKVLQWLIRLIWRQVLKKYPGAQVKLFFSDEESYKIDPLTVRMKPRRIPDGWHKLAETHGPPDYLVIDFIPVGDPNADWMKGLEDKLDKSDAKNSEQKNLLIFPGRG